MKARIIGTGSFCPDAVTDDKFIEVYGKKAIAVKKLLQHHSRYLATDIVTGESNYSNVEMGYNASIKALESASLEADDIDMIIYSTITPNYVVPPCFSLLQEKLMIKKCIGFDIRSGCAGFGTALTIAETYIKMGTVKHVLVVGSDLLSTRFTNYKKLRNDMPLKTLFNYMFFGDSAGAIILSGVVNEMPGFIYSKMCSDSVQYPEGSMIEIGGSVAPYPTEEIKEERWAIYQAAQYSDKYLPKVLIEAMRELEKDSPITLNEISTFIMPVESKIIKNKVLKEFPQIKHEQIFSCGDTGGAMINAAIPVSLDNAIRNGKFHIGDKILIYAAENTKWQHAILVTEW